MSDMSPISQVQRHARTLSRDKAGAMEGPKPRIPSEQWEAKRAVITHLYQEEKKSLKEVMEILERDQGFSATVKMFKSRICKWGLDKKLKSEEVLAIMVQKRERDLLGKESEFTIRGQPVDMDNINRYIKRNPQLVARFNAGEVPSISVAMVVECHTPRLSSAMPALHSHDSHDNQYSMILGLLSKHIEDMFQSGSWRWEYNVSCSTGSADDHGEDLFERFFSCLGVASQSMARRDPVHLGSILEPAFEVLKALVRSKSPVFAVRMICMLWFLSTHQRNNLLRLMSKHLAGLSPIVLGEDHPITHIWRWVATDPFRDYTDFCSAAYDMLVPLLEARVGPANLLTTMLYGDHVDFLFQNGMSQQALAMCRVYVHRGEATGQQHVWMQELSTAESVMLGFQDDDTNQCAAGISTTRSEEAQGTHLIQLSFKSLQKGDTATAITQLSQARQLLESNGCDDRLILTALANLEQAHAAAGNSLDAERLRNERLRRTNEFALDTSALAVQHKEARPRAMDIAVNTEMGGGEEGLGLWSASPASAGDASLGTWSPAFMSPSSATYPVHGGEREWQVPS